MSASFGLLQKGKFMTAEEGSEVEDEDEDEDEVGGYTRGIGWPCINAWHPTEDQRGHR